MATRPKIKTLTNSSVNVLNAIRNSATQNYRDYVPVATADADSVKAIGAVIMDFPALQNEFLSALVNRIAKVIVTSKLYENPLRMFKKGILDLGESIEEIFVDLAKPFEFNPEASETTFMKREMPDVHSAFHIMNYKKFYKSTVSQDQLRTAFLSWDGVSDLIARIVQAMYTGANYDEYQTMKYMLAVNIVDGHLYPVTTPTVDKENASDIITAVKGISNDMEFMKDKYNLAGVRNYATKEQQYLLMNATFDAISDVNVLASAFNMDKAQFLGHKVLVDGFGDLDVERLDELFKGDPTYRHFDSATLAALNTIPAVLVGEDYFMIFDNLINMTENYNGEGLYWNYFYHTWKTFSVSPFVNAAMFIPAVPTIESVAITPKAAQAAAGTQVQLKVEVTNTNFAPRDVVWSIESGTGATVDQRGLVTLGADAAGQITVKATSYYDNTKSDTATITVV